MGTLQHWSQAAVSSFCEFAASSLNLQNMEEGAHTDQLPRGSQGAYLPLLTPSAALHLGVVAHRDIMQELAGALLMLESGEQLSEEDTVDACSEITNVLGGMIKSQMVDTEGEIKLGLPLFSFNEIDWRGSAKCDVIRVCQKPEFSIVVVYSAF